MRLLFDSTTLRCCEQSSSTAHAAHSLQCNVILSSKEQDSVRLIITPIREKKGNHIGIWFPLPGYEFYTCDHSVIYYFARHIQSTQKKKE